MKKNMKKTFTIGILLCALVNAAQPVILNGSNLPAPGFSAPVSKAIATVGIGSAGINQTWNFSLLTFTPLGTLSVITPSSSPIGASFPTANYAYSFAGTYSFFKTSVGQMEAQANSITTPGSGNDLTPNPETILKFPFNYLDTLSDTWQKVGDPVKNVTLTYDGYGTLITPTTTYSNVVRIKEDYGAGIVDYRWYSLNPLIFIMTYSNGANELYYVGATANGINDPNNSNLLLNIYPNPFTSSTTLKINSATTLKNTELKIYDVLGKEVKQIPVNSSEIAINRDELENGIYFYRLINSNEIIATGKLIIN